MPVVSIPFMGDQTFYQNQEKISLFILLNAVLVIGISFTRLKIFLWILGLLISGAVYYVYYDIQNTISEFDKVMGGEQGSIFFTNIKKSFLESIKIRYGIYILTAGIILTFVSAAWKK